MHKIILHMGEPIKEMIRDADYSDRTYNWLIKQSKKIINWILDHFWRY